MSASVEEKLIEQLKDEKLSACDLLKEFAGGKELSKTDIDLCNEVREILPEPVIKVLIYYVMLRTEMKFTKKIVRAIASNWAKENIKTVEEAMEIAKKQNRLYREHQEQLKNKQQEKVREAKIKAMAKYHESLLTFGDTVKELAKQLDLSVHDTLLLMNEYRQNDVLRDIKFNKSKEAPKL